LGPAGASRILAANNPPGWVVMGEGGLRRRLPL
jgi:hypothetical protein